MITPAPQYSTKAPFAGHPAYDAATRNHVETPRPGPRVKPEAQENAMRNRGSVNLSWDASSSSHGPPQTPSSAGGRYCSDAGRENLIRSRGSMLNVLQKQGSTPREAVRCRATKPEASGNAEQSRGGRMNMLFTNYGHNETTPRPNPRVKSEAAENYSMARGSAMNNILHNPQSMPSTARAGPRVKPEAEMIAMKNRGSMNSIMRTCTPRY